MLDEIDKKIIKVLEDDARTSLRKISELVKVSLGTVSNRVKKILISKMRDFFLQPKQLKNL